MIGVLQLDIFLSIFVLEQPTNGRFYVTQIISFLLFMHAEILFLFLLKPRNVKEELTHYALLGNQYLSHCFAFHCSFP